MFTYFRFDMIKPPDVVLLFSYIRGSFVTARFYWSCSDLKYTLTLTHFHAKKRPFIKKDIFSRMTFYNFASLLRLHTIFTQQEGTHVYHINAAFAAHIAREFLPGFVPVDKVESLIAKFLLPVRPGRQKPGNMRVKRPTSFQYRMI